MDDPKEMQSLRQNRKKKKYLGVVRTLNNSVTNYQPPLPVSFKLKLIIIAVNVMQNQQYLSSIIQSWSGLFEHKQFLLCFYLLLSFNATCFSLAIFKAALELVTSLLKVFFYRELQAQGLRNDCSSSSSSSDIPQIWYSSLRLVSDWFKISFFILVWDWFQFSLRLV